MCNLYSMTKGQQAIRQFTRAARVADRGQASTIFAADGTAFTTAHNSLDGNAALLGLGVSAGQAAWSIYANYAAHIAGNWTGQTGELGVEAKF